MDSELNIKENNIDSVVIIGKKISLLFFFHYLGLS